MEAGSDGRTTALNSAELLLGARLSGRAGDEISRVNELLARIPQVPFGPRAARSYGEIAAGLWKSGKYPGDFDALVASIALAESATVVTRNVRHFAGIDGINVEKW